jgi:hypothetical protein
VNCKQFTLFFLLLLTSCEGTLSPLRGKIDVGREPYAVFVGGEGTSVDLYAVRSNGGPVFPLTYSAVAELKPALAPNGTDLAFLRGHSVEDTTAATVWVMNLLNGAERELALPQDAGPPRRVGWTWDGEFVVVQTKNGLYRFSAPPGQAEAEVVSPEDRAAAESTLAVLLGDPVFARVVTCPRKPRDLCVVTRKGRSALLAQAVRAPLRWGPDSVAFFVGDRVQIRPLGRGRGRMLLWSNWPKRPREMTFFPGAGS